MSSDAKASEAVFWTLLGGGALIASGLRLFQKKRLLENIGRSTVRGAAVGLVELSGMSRGCNPTPSPVQGAKCSWWRCVIEEWRKQGKNSSWVEIGSRESQDQFYLEDSTGRILIVPVGAEYHLREFILELNSSTRTRLAPILQGWGYNDMNWFGFSRKLRIREEIIPEGFPLYVFGNMVAVAEMNAPNDKAGRWQQRLSEIKKNKGLMNLADKNQDGSVDGQEWDALREEQQLKFLEEEAKRASQAGQPGALIMAPEGSPFIISVHGEDVLTKKFTWQAPLMIGGGTGLIILGLWLATKTGWPLLVAVILVVGGYIAAWFSMKGVSKWRWRF